MRKITSLLSLMCLVVAFSFAQTATSKEKAAPVSKEKVNLVTGEEVNPNAPEFAWVEEVHDFGNIPQGIPVTNKFEFTNNGKEPLIVTNVQKTCGCTVTEWSKEPILPGQTGFVEAQFNAARPGAFNKAITVQSNANTPNKKLFFKGTVDKKEEDLGEPVKKSIFDPNM